MKRFIRNKIVLLFLLAAGKLAAQPPAGPATGYRFEAGGLAIVLDSSIAEPQRWQALLSADTTFPAYFRRRAFARVCIKAIRPTGARHFECRILAAAETGSPLPAAAGYALYDLFLCPGRRDHLVVCRLQFLQAEL